MNLPGITFKDYPHLTPNPKLVIVHVRGGVADAHEVPDGVTVRIVDFDNDRSGETHDEITGPAGPH